MPTYIHDEPGKMREVKDPTLAHFIIRLLNLTLLYTLWGLIIVLIIFSNVGTGFNAFDRFGQVTSSARINMIAYTAINRDPTTIGVATLCKNESTANQPACVVANVKEFFVFTPNKDPIRTPETTRLEGGVCRDITALYASVFKQLGWYTEYRYPTPTHVYVSVRKAIECPEDTDKICYIYCDINNTDLEECVIM